MAFRVRFDRLFLLLTCFLLIASILFLTVFFKVRPIIYTYAKSCAETLFLNSANNAVVNILKENDISYDNIANLSKNEDGNICSLEIDIEKINLLKSLISNEMSRNLSGKERCDLKIPLGTLLGSEYAAGFGPKINFSMYTTATAIVDFKSNFYSAGINQVLHQIIITIKIKGNVLMLGFSESFCVETTAIAAQTVIVGLTPDAYTNVIEGNSGEEVVGDIFDYGYLQ